MNELNLKFKKNNIFTRVYSCNLSTLKKEVFYDFLKYLDSKYEGKSKSMLKNSENMYYDLNSEQINYLISKEFNKIEYIYLNYSTLDKSFGSYLYFKGDTSNHIFITFSSETNENINEIKQILVNKLNCLDTGKDNLLGVILNNKKIDKNYVSLKRISDLKSIDSEEFDLTKLIKLCEELNLSYSNDCYFSVLALVRMIIDHIPPIFGFKNFSEVSGQITGKSIKKSFSNLETNLRNISDRHIHNQIRKSESLPVESQVDFIASLDVVLEEVYRLLK
jgi:hypothetical protein